MNYIAQLESYVYKLEDKLESIEDKQSNKTDVDEVDVIDKPSNEKDTPHCNIINCLWYFWFRFY
jgi:hypothetical protein